MRELIAENPVNGDQIESEIEKLRSECEDTQQLYNEVCALLFFRYGVTPTANKLYQLVRKGSMSAPAQALTRFWKILREKSRTRIEHPDLPETLTETAGEMVAALWQRAQTLALENLEGFRVEAQASVMAEKTTAIAATREMELAQKRLEEKQEQLRNCGDQLIETQQLLAKGQGENSALARRLEELSLECRRLEDALHANQQQMERQRVETTAAQESYENNLRHAQLEISHERTNGVRLQEELEKIRLLVAEQQREFQNILQSARQEFVTELSHQRQTAVASAEHYQNELKRARYDIEHERANTVRAQKELEQIRYHATERAERDRALIDELQHEHAKLNQRLGELEGALSEARAVWKIPQRRKKSAKHSEKKIV